MGEKFARVWVFSNVLTKYTVGLKNKEETLVFMHNTLHSCFFLLAGSHLNVFEHVQERISHGRPGFAFVSAGGAPGVQLHSQKALLK